MTAQLTANASSRVEVLAIAADARRLALGDGVDVREAASLALVVAELGMNAVLHGGGSAQVQVSVEPEGWTVAVEDAGPGLSPAVLADAGRSDRLGPEGVRAPGDGRSSFGSGLAGVRRLAGALALENRGGGGARAEAHRRFPKFTSTQTQRGS